MVSTGVGTRTRVNFEYGNGKYDVVRYSEQVGLGWGFGCPVAFVRYATRLRRAWLQIVFDGSNYSSPSQ